MNKAFSKIAMIFIMILLASVVVLAACGGDDEDKETQSPTPEPTLTPEESTPPPSPEPSPTPEASPSPTLPQLSAPGWIYDVTYGNDAKIEANTTRWTITVTEGEADTIVATAAIEGTAKVNFYFPPMAMAFGVDVEGQTIIRNKTDLSMMQEDFVLTVKSVNMTLAATRSFQYAGDHGAPFEVGKTWSYEAPVDVTEQGVHLDYAFTAEVVGIEDVTVPAGTFSCYKIVLTSGEKTSTEWWAVDGQFLTPVKYVDGITYVGTQTFELVAYQAP